jgi:hypothetical protein
VDYQIRVPDNTRVESGMREEGELSAAAGITGCDLTPGNDRESR